QPYRKILVCVSPKSDDRALSKERSIVKAFAPYPVAAAACLDVFPVPTQPTTDAIVKAAHDQSFDAVLVWERGSIIHWPESSGKQFEEENLQTCLDAYSSDSGSEPGPIGMRV